jgi:hypothetical protein
VSPSTARRPRAPDVQARTVAAIAPQRRPAPPVGAPAQPSAARAAVQETAREAAGRLEGPAPSRRSQHSRHSQHFPQGPQSTAARLAAAFPATPPAERRAAREAGLTARGSAWAQPATRRPLQPATGIERVGGRRRRTPPRSRAQCQRRGPSPMATRRTPPGRRSQATDRRGRPCRRPRRSPRATPFPPILSCPPAPST